MAKRLSGSGCRLGGEWVGRKMGALDWSGVRQRGRGNFGGKCRASHCNQLGLCDVVILCREGWRRGSSRISLGFIVQLEIRGRA